MRIKDLIVPSAVKSYRTPLLITRTFINQTTALSNWTVPLPNPTVAGRLMVLFISVIQGRSISMPGWNLVVLAGVVGAAKSHQMAWKIATDGETSINVSFLGNLSQGVACYYELDDIDTTTTFYDLTASANQDGAGAYTSATSNTFQITRPTIAFSSTVWVGGSVAWSPNNSFITQGSSNGATAHRIYSQPAANQNVTWTKGVGGTTSSTKVSVVEFYGKVNTTPNYEFAGYGPAFEPGYQNILNAAIADGATLPSPFWQARQNKLYKRWNDVGFITANDWLYNFTHDGGENFNYYNWKNPGAYKITKFGTTIFNSLAGVRIATINSYYNTNYSAQTSSINYGGTGYYSMVIDTTGTGQDDGMPFGKIGGGGAGNIYLQTRKTNNTAVLYLTMITNALTVTNMELEGFYVGTKASGVVSLWKNDVLLGSRSDAVLDPQPAGSMFVLARAVSASTADGYYGHPIRLAALGGELTQVQREEARAAWLEYITI